MPRAILVDLNTAPFAGLDLDLNAVTLTQPPVKSATGGTLIPRSTSRVSLDHGVVVTTCRPGPLALTVATRFGIQWTVDLEVPFGSGLVNVSDLFEAGKR